LKKILFVDDEEDVRASLSFRLRAMGYDVIGARDGREAIQMAVAHRPDIILMDLKLPDIDGRLVSRRIRTKPGLEQVPVIFVTADATVRPSDNSPLEAYLVKPFPAEELLVRIERLMGQRARFI